MNSDKVHTLGSDLLRRTGREGRFELIRLGGGGNNRLFEIRQGNARPDGLMIESIGPPCHLRPLYGIGASRGSPAING
mgnify:CR=1 FL=1